MASGTPASTTASTQDSAFLNYGVATMPIGTTGSAARLLTLSSNWPSSTIFAFEVTSYNGVGSASYIDLYDVTSATSIVQISTGSTTATVIRSGQFTLTPGHVYAVSLRSSSGGNAYITDSSLIVFG